MGSGTRWPIYFLLVAGLLAVVVTVTFVSVSLGSDDPSAASSATSTPAAPVTATPLPGSTAPVIDVGVTTLEEWILLVNAECLATVDAVKQTEEELPALFAANTLDEARANAIKARALVDSIADPQAFRPESLPTATPDRQVAERLVTEARSFIAGFYEAIDLMENQDPTASALLLSTADTYRSTNQEFRDLGAEDCGS